MALTKDGYTAAIQGTTRIQALIDDNGYLVSDTALAAGTKYFSINSVAAENTLTDNTDVLNFFFGLANAEFTSSTNRMQVTWNAAK